MSGYQKPSVLVWQEIVRESPGAGSVPLLTTIVAPFRAVRQHVDYGRNLMVGKFSNANITFEEVFKFNFPGMEVIPEEVKVLASGEFSLFETDETFTITTGGYVLTDNINHTNPDLLKAEVGDTLILKDGTSDVVTRIINVTVEETSIAFTLSNIIQNTAAYSYEVVKSLELVDITASPLVDTNLEQAKLTITAGATASTPFGNLELRYCDIFVEYMAIRKDKTAEVMFVNSNTLQSVVDISDERNPLGYAAAMALMANGGMEIALISAEDTEEGHMRAISTMKSFAVARTDVYLYYLSVITDYPAFFDLYIAMIDEGTDPSKARYACLHRYTTVPEYISVMDNPDAIGIIKVNAFGQGKLFEDLGASFLVAGITPGMKILGVRGSVTVEMVVDKVINDNLIEIMGSVATGAYDSYTIVSDLDTQDKQAVYVKQVSEGIKNRRVINMFPARHRFNGVEISEKYGPVKLAALASRFPTQVGFTNMDMPLMDSVIYPGGFQWSEEAMDTVASGGTFVLMNIGAESVICRHQLTTDMDDVKTREYSIVKNFDYCTLQFKSVLDPYIGRWNIITSMFASMNAAVEAVETLLKEDHIDRYGPPLIEITDRTVAKDPDALDGSIVELELEIPTPHNTCKMRVRI